MSGREQADCLPGHAARLQQRQDTGEILRPSDTQGDDGEMNRLHHAERHPVKVGRFGLLQRLASERSEDRHELGWPRPDADGLTLES